MQEMRFTEKLSPYLRALSKKSEAIRSMYIFNPDDKEIIADTNRDLLNEKIASPVFGVVRKYEGQILILVSYTCISNCRYCERQDRVGVGLDKLGRLTLEQIDKIVDYIDEDTTIYEVIASGGDPLTNPKGLKYLFERLSKIDHVKVLRIHTRFPLQAPNQVDIELLKVLVKAKDTVYLSIHIDHPDELQSETISLIRQMKSLGFILLSQSVFLRGINDNVEILKSMFLQLFELGVRPYYLYHCEEIPATKQFVIPINEEIAIMTRLRNEVSGLAFPQHVIDIPKATGKVIFPSNHWNVDISVVTDFKGEKIRTKDWRKI